MSLPGRYQDLFVLKTLFLRCEFSCSFFFFVSWSSNISRLVQLRFMGRCGCFVLRCHCQWECLRARHGSLPSRLLFSAFILQLCCLFTSHIHTHTPLYLSLSLHSLTLAHSVSIVCAMRFVRMNNKNNMVARMSRVWEDNIMTDEEKGK